MKYIFRVLVIVYTLLNSVNAADSSAVNYEVKVSKFLMGTIVETTTSSPDINKAKNTLYLAYQEMQRVEDLLSYAKENSEISKINDRAGKKAVHVSSETMAILHRSVEYAKKLHGLFDITIGPITYFWGFSSDGGGHLPTKSQISTSLKLVNYKDLQLNDQDTTAFLKKAGMRLDLGGIAKGYAIDRGSYILKKNGINNFILNAGGDMYVSGQKSDENAWRIGIKNPRNQEKLIASFELKNYAVATSGDYERFIIVNNQRYHHIIDTRTGYPGRLSESSTTFAASAEMADVMATYLFIIGTKRALNEKSFSPFLIIDQKGNQVTNDSFNKLAGLKFNEL